MIGLLRMGYGADKGQRLFHIHGKLCFVGDGAEGDDGAGDEDEDGNEDGDRDVMFVQFNV